MRLDLKSPLLLFESSSLNLSSDRLSGSGCLQTAHVSLFFSVRTGDFLKDMFLEFRFDSFEMAAESLFLPRSYSNTAFSYMLFMDMRGCLSTAWGWSLFNFIGVIVFATNDFDFYLWWRLIIFVFKNYIYVKGVFNIKNLI